MADDRYPMDPRPTSEDVNEYEETYPTDPRPFNVLLRETLNPLELIYPEEPNPTSDEFNSGTLTNVSINAVRPTTVERS